MYRTFVIGYNPKASEMAACVQDKANELAEEGLSVVSFSITGSGKAIILATDGKDPEIAK